MIKCLSSVSDCIFVDAITDTLRLKQYDCEIIMDVSIFFYVTVTECKNVKKMHSREGILVYTNFI